MITIGWKTLIADQIVFINHFLKQHFTLNEIHEWNLGGKTLKNIWIDFLSQWIPSDFHSSSSWPLFVSIFFFFFSFRFHFEKLSQRKKRERVKIEFLSSMFVLHSVWIFSFKKKKKNFFLKNNGFFPDRIRNSLWF